MIDSHCHLYLEPLYSDLPGVFERARASNTEQMICPGIDIKTSKVAVKMAADHSQIFAAVGIPPHNADKAPLDFIRKLEALLNKPKIVAIGEIGLDFYRNYSDKEIQRKVFIEQLQLAKELDLPVIIHNRNADQEIIQILSENFPIKGVAHCFSSDMLTAKKLLDLGLYVSFAGNLTYKNSKLIEIAKELPLDKLLIETDAPFLSPVPFRGKENEPSRLINIAEKLAKCKNLPVKKIEESTSQNTKNLFNLKLA